MAVLQMGDLFRVGIDHGWKATFESLLGSHVRDVFDSRPDIEWEVMADPIDGVASAEVIDQYDGLVILGTPFRASSFEGVKRLACISRWGVGFDMIDIAAAGAADVMVALTPEAIKRSVAESQIALIFALAKRLPDLDRRTRAGIWRTDLPIYGIDVKGRTLSSVGLGRIGSEMFKMARGIGFGRLLAYDPYCSEALARDIGVDLVSLETVMSEGDFVTVNAFLNSETRGMIGAAELALMKPTAYFVNTARGPIVDEAALVQVLRGQCIAGAGLDVFEREPPAADNPLLAMDNVILSPHSMAWTQEGMAGNSRDACRNLASVASGEVPACLADPAVVNQEGVQAKLARWRKS
ncbi:MAG: hypothetical protein OXJ37_19180 [Bryobacterales bacterium]|nr:hypothetical protein [Bryobacterales bacterium]